MANTRISALTEATVTASGDFLAIDNASSSTRKIDPDNVLGDNLVSIKGQTTAANKLSYWSGAGTASLADLTAFARTILDDASASAARTTLELVIGTDVQAYDAGLASIAGLTTAADRMIYTSALDTYAVTPLTSFARSILDDTDEATFKATVNLEIGTDVQAYDADLDALAGLSSNGMIARTGAGTASARTITGTSGEIAVTNGDGVSGNPTLGLASIADDTILANVSGSAGPASANTITQVLDAVIGNTQGAIIYRGASAWTKLDPGTDGQFLKTQGAAANPEWFSIPGGGDMLSTNNLSDVASAETARDNLGVEIGADVQAFDAQLSSLIRQVSKSADYTTVLTDGGKHILHPASDDNARTFTIDSNANVAYPIGTVIVFDNEINTVTIAITSDTLELVGSGATGSRTLAAKGQAVAMKTGTTKWRITGTGLT